MGTRQRFIAQKRGELAYRNYVFKICEDIFRVPALTDAFPGSQFVYMVRCARDVVHSMAFWSRESHPVRAFSEDGETPDDRIVNATKRWKRYEDAGIDLLRQNRLDVFVVSYEDLVMDPFTELDKLSDFLRVDDLFCKPNPNLMGESDDWASHYHDLFESVPGAVETERMIQELLSKA